MSKKDPELLVAEDWNGYLSLRCTRCRFAALQDRQISQHLVRAHGVDAADADAAAAKLRSAQPSPAPVEEAAEQEAEVDG